MFEWNTKIKDDNFNESIFFSKMINDCFSFENVATRGVRQAGFLVLRKTEMPSVLVELGFLTNRKEGAYLNSKNGQREMSMAIKDAILEYQSGLDKNVTNYNVVESISTDAAEIDDIIYKVQISASSKSIETKSYNFKGLDDISKIQEGSLYKYYYGNTSNYDTANGFVQEAKTKGYKSCFIVAFKDGKKIPLSEALKSTSN